MAKNTTVRDVLSALIGVGDPPGIIAPPSRDYPLWRRTLASLIGVRLHGGYHIGARPPSPPNPAPSKRQPSPLNPTRPTASARGRRSCAPGTGLPTFDRSGPAGGAGPAGARGAAPAGTGGPGPLHGQPYAPAEPARVTVRPQKDPPYVGPVPYRAGRRPVQVPAAGEAPGNARVAGGAARGAAAEGTPEALLRSLVARLKGTDADDAAEPVLRSRFDEDQERLADRINSRPDALWAVVVEETPTTGGEEAGAAEAASLTLCVLWAGESSWSSPRRDSTAGGDAAQPGRPARAGAEPGDEASTPSQAADAEFNVVTVYTFRILLDALFAEWPSAPPTIGEQTIEVIKIVIQPRGLAIKLATITIDAFLHARGLGLLAPAAARQLSRTLGSILNALLGPAQHGTLLKYLNLAEDALYAANGRLTDSPDIRATLRGWIDNGLLRPGPPPRAHDRGQATRPHPGPRGAPTAADPGGGARPRQPSAGENADNPAPGPHQPPERGAAEAEAPSRGERTSTPVQRRGTSAGTPQRLTAPGRRPDGSRAATPIDGNRSEAPQPRPETPTAKLEAGPQTGTGQGDGRTGYSGIRRRPSVPTPEDAPPVPAAELTRPGRRHPLPARGPHEPPAESVPPSDSARLLPESASNAANPQEERNDDRAARSREAPATDVRKILLNEAGEADSPGHVDGPAEGPDALGPAAGPGITAI